MLTDLDNYIEFQHRFKTKQQKEDFKELFLWCATQFGPKWNSLYNPDGVWNVSPHNIRAQLWHFKHDDHAVLFSLKCKNTCYKIR